MNTIRLFTFSLLTAGCFGANAQVGNPNFEDWVETDTLWTGEMQYAANQWTGGHRTTDSYAGNYAARIEPYLSCGMARDYMVYGTIDPMHFNPWVLQLDFTGSGAPINFKPEQLNGYYKFLSPDTNDEASGVVVLKKYNAFTHTSEEVGRGEIQFTPTTGYSPFTINITDLQPGVMPDSIAIAFSSGMGFSWDGENTIFGTVYVDQLRFKGQGTTAGLKGNVLIQSRFYPNPASDLLHFSFTTTVNDQFSLVMTDASGRIVVNQPAEPWKESSVDLKGLPAGAYQVCIYGKGGVYAEETIVKNGY